MRMKLFAKGRRVPPPVLAPTLQRLSEEVQSWPDIIASTHWHLSRNGQVDGADFYRGNDELGHVHLNGELHLAASPGLARALVAAKLARPAPWEGCEEWVLYSIRSEREARLAGRFMRLAYDYLGGTPECELVGALAQSITESTSAELS